MTRRLTTLAVLFGSLAAVASAQDDYRHGRVLSVDAGVTLQRATEPGAEEAVPNLPFLPGDRVWTDRAGRAEFQFADGTVLRLDAASKLDYVAHDEGAGDRVILRLWSGALYLHNRDGRGYADFGIETPGGVVEARMRGVYRVDALEGETRLSVYEGEAALQADREVQVRAGERVHARQGEPVEEPQGFDRAALDDFDQWNADREDRQAYAANRRDYLPASVLPYAGELDAYGAWYYQSEIGHVWRPYVSSGWRPYFDGRWAWTSFGWTWVASEPWGWAPFHYGRWGYTPMLGWYWIPGNAWGPAWVNWAYGGDYIGWCPLGHHDKAVPYGGRRADGGRAVPRGAVAGDGEPWAYVRRADFAAADLMRKIQPTLPAGQEVHAVEHVQARPGRDLTSVHVRRGHDGARRGTRRRGSGPGTPRPELRADPAATSRFPTARRSHRSTGEASARGRAAGLRARSRLARPARPSRAGGAGGRAPGASPGAAPDGRGPRGASPGVRSPEPAAPRRGPGAPRHAAVLERPRPGGAPERRAHPRSPAAPRVQPGSTPVRPR